MDHPPPPLQRATLAEQIESHIKELIVSDQLEPGDVLPSSIDLAAEFGVSRTIVREAMKSLEAKGLIEIANGKRARVQPITNRILVDFLYRFTRPHKEAVIELLELRRGIEVQGAILAAQRRTAEDMQTIWAHVRGMETRIGDADGYLDLDVQLHLAIAAASKNRMLYRLLESIREVMRDSMEEGLVRNLNRTEWEYIQSTHVQLVTLIDKQDASAAGTCMASHFDTHIQEILILQSRTAGRSSRSKQ
jgi:DNA-binding FadR family transcriptional regulator